MRLSAVIPTHHTPRLLARCLDSLGRSTEPPDEIVVIDDGGDDETARLLASEHPNVTQLRHARPEGYTRSVNEGAELAGGDLLWLLNSDTEVSPTAGAELRRAFGRNPSLGIAGARLHYPDGRAQWSGGGIPGSSWLFLQATGWPRMLSGLPAYRRLRAAWGVDGSIRWVTGAALCIRRSTWEQAGPLDEGFAFYCQDLDLCVRAGDLGWQVAVLPEVEVLHHHGSTIRRSGETGGGRADLRALWTDLLRWSGKHGGAAGWTRARRALLLGGRLRLATLRWARATGAARDRSEADSRIQHLKSALHQLRSQPPPDDGG
jgi:GT2 family glycosyltransferase